MASLREDIDNILEIRGPEPDIVPVKLAEHIVLASLFTAPIEPVEPSDFAKRHLSSRTTDGMDARARK